MSRGQAHPSPNPAQGPWPLSLPQGLGRSRATPWGAEKPWDLDEAPLQ